jgi:Putative metallopeptidase
MVLPTTRHVSLVGFTRRDMVQHYFHRTRRTGWSKSLFLFIALACMSSAGSSAAALASARSPLPASFNCAPAESAKVVRAPNHDYSGGNVEPTAALPAFPNGRPDLSVDLRANIVGGTPLQADDLPSTADMFQAGIDEVARDLEKEPRWRRLTQQRRARAEFVFGNMLFVVIHELGHALVSELDLMVLGREEDVADAYATIGVLKCGADFARVLVEAAKGLFLSAQRDRKAGDAPQYYQRHGLDEQRAYQIVCLMYGSDPSRFKDLADETELPQDRRRSCGWDYDTASRSWDRALSPHMRMADQPKPQIEVIYGEAKGGLATYARIFKSSRFLETVIEQVADRFGWPASIVVEMRSCGEPNARWTIPTRTLHVCYELAQEFVELYRDFGGDRTLAQLRLTPVKRATVRPQNITQSIGAWKRLHGTAKRGHTASHR